MTGAARGQGRAHAVALAAEGADIIVTDLCADIATVPYPLGTAAELAETVAMVEATGQRCLSMPADIRDTAGIGLVVEAGIEAFGQIDICVANAGVTGYGKFHELDDDTWNDMIDVDLTGTFKTIRCSAPYARASLWAHHRHLIDGGSYGKRKPRALRGREVGSH